VKATIEIDGDSLTFIGRHADVFTRRLAELHRMGRPVTFDNDEVWVQDPAGHSIPAERGEHRIRLVFKRWTSEPRPEAAQALVFVVRY
jgi:hypothetical protein